MPSSLRILLLDRMMRTLCLVNDFAISDANLVSFAHFDVIYQPFTFQSGPEHDSILATTFMEGGSNIMKTLSGSHTPLLTPLKSHSYLQSEIQLP